MTENERLPSMSHVTVSSSDSAASVARGGIDGTEFRAPAGKPHLTIEPSTGWSPLRLAQIWRYRDLLFSLAIRDVKLRYRQTALGVIWVVLQPLMAAAILSFVFGKVARLSSEGSPYFIFAFTGLLGWNVFNSTLTKASACLVGNSQLISKVYFPRMILPLSTVFSTLIDFAVALVLLAVMMAFAHIVPTPRLLLLPAWTFLLLMAAIGLGLYTSALIVEYRDLQYVIPVLLQFLLYASPVAYGLLEVPRPYRAIFHFNPLSGLLEAFRWSVLGKGDVHWPGVTYSFVSVTTLFVVGALSFKKMERRFADVI
jgi:lipopolysaccharide transport system permease protein